MKKLWTIASTAALLLIAAVLLAMRVEHKLQVAASEQLLAQGSVFEGVSVAFSGRQATLSGTVLRDTERQRALNLLEEELQVAPALPLGAHYNPVRAVIDELSVKPRALGWSVLAANATKVRVHGLAATANESQRLVEGVRSAGLLGEALSQDLSIDDELLMEAAPLEPTLNSVPDLMPAARLPGVLAVAKLGEPWFALDLSLPLQALRTQLVAHGMPASAWEEGMAAEALRMRTVRDGYMETIATQQRLTSLPSGHVILAIRGGDVLLKGELGGETFITQLLEVTQKAYPKHRINDAIQYSTRRRPEATPNVLTSALPSLPMDSAGKLLAIGIPGKGWSVQDVHTLTPELAETLPATAWPAESDPRLARPDLVACATWLIGSHEDTNSHQAAHYPPHLLLAAYANRVLLRGVVADEATRSQLEAAARRVYAGKELIMDIRLDASRDAPASALQTILSLPAAPAPEATAILAFAIPGDVWKSRAARLWLLEPNGFATSNLMPKTFPVNLALPDLAEIAPYLRTHQRETLEASKGLPGSLLLAPSAK